MRNAAGSGTGRVTVAQLRALATLQGLAIDDDRLARLVPLVQALVDGAAALDALDLDGIEPAPVFRAAWQDGDGDAG